MYVDRKIETCYLVIGPKALYFLGDSKICNSNLHYLNMNNVSEQKTFKLNCHVCEVTNLCDISTKTFFFLLPSITTVCIMYSIYILMYLEEGK